MSLTEKYLGLNQKLQGKLIASAASELTAFTLKFEDGSGLLLQVLSLPDTNDIDAQIMPAEELPEIGDAVCKIEWAWIKGAKIESIVCVPGSFKLILDPVGPLTIASQLWQGKAFLSFQPYRAST